MSKEKIIQFCDRIIEICAYTILVVATFSISLVEIAASIMIVTWFIKTACVGNFKSANVLPVKLLFAFWIWTVISCINSSYSSENLRGVLKVGEYSLVFLIAFTHLWQNRALEKGLFAVIAGVVLSCINGFYQYFTGEGFIRHRTLIPKDYMHRISSSFIHPNDFGVYLCVATVIFISFLFLKNSRFRNKLFFLILSSLSITSLFFTKSRGAWISFTVSFLVLGALKGKKVLAVFLMLLIIMFVMLPHTARERIFSLTDFQDGTTKERLTLWKGTIDMIKEHPILGFGVNTYSRVFPDYRPRGYPDVRYTHNSYLQMASEVGIVGAFLFLISLITILVYSFRGLLKMPEGQKKVFASGLFAGLIGFFLNAAVDTHLYSVVLAVFSHLLLGLCFALTYHAQKD